ncbi:hypothetical protein H5410_004074 [Solanum commersonii]|uniref:Uncharacterized protein n=1 Tax=Solanum commersonii TaxID=4109 RepID=A0A9J6B6D2_SOLCO|nr:hypothetical protein H5410_004074 [Solanum commersonii]
MEDCPFMTLKGILSILCTCVALSWISVSKIMNFKGTQGFKLDYLRRVSLHSGQCFSPCIHSLNSLMYKFHIIWYHCLPFTKVHIFGSRVTTEGLCAMVKFVKSLRVQN